MRKAVFLDRDGTLNVDKGYTYKIEDLEVIEGVPEAIKIMTDLGYLVFVVSNQSGIGRRYYSWMDTNKFNLALKKEIEKGGGRIHSFHCCPHAPGYECCCRKPKPGMIYRIAVAHEIRLSDSWTIGDKNSDIKAGQAAGTHVGIVDETHTLLDFVKAFIQ